MASFLFRRAGRPKTSCRAGQDMPLAVYRFPVGSGMGLTGIVKGVPRYTPQAGGSRATLGPPQRGYLAMTSTSYASVTISAVLCGVRC